MKNLQQWAQTINGHHEASTTSKDKNDNIIIGCRIEVVRKGVVSNISESHLYFLSFKGIFALFENKKKWNICSAEWVV